jgi:uncharacterized protein (DUF488 family)
MKIFSIGFENRDFEKLMRDLKKVKVRNLIDVRCFPEAESAGYARGALLTGRLGGITYRHMGLLAPTSVILDDYFKKGLSWEKYEIEYLRILKERKVEDRIGKKIYEVTSCLFCFEHDPAKCHRRLGLEYLQEHWESVRVVHL